jgi:hypothetical protein
VAVVGALTRGLAKSQRKVVAGQTAVTGTGAITSGLSVLDVGSPQLTVQNSATTVPTGGSTAAVTSVSTGTINAVVVDQQAAANAVAGGAKNVGWLATGQ